jgi:superfamily II DNA/RNA helicase
MSKIKEKTSLEFKQEISTMKARDEEDDEWDIAEQKQSSKKANTGETDPDKTDVVLESEENKIKIVNSFGDMDLQEELLRGLYEVGFDTPAHCQRYIPTLIESSGDVIIQAEAGSGKTLTFAIVAIQKVVLELNQLQIIILTSTRELALQTFEVIVGLAKHLLLLNIALHRGVLNKNKDTDHSGFKTTNAESYVTARPGLCERGKEQIIVATPGKLLDIITSKKSNYGVSTKFVQLLIMDEADQLLNPNDNIDTIKSIFNNIDTFEDCQKLIVSATFPDHILDTCKFILQPNALRILVKKEKIVATNIKQYYISLENEEHKAICLLDLYKKSSIQVAVIFVKTKPKGIYLNEIMTEAGHTVKFIHAGLSQKERDHIMTQFRQGLFRVLIATDLLARGIDIQSISTVINYDLPANKEDYAHRIGRAGRYGKIGSAINFVVNTSNSTPPVIAELERFYCIKIPYLPDLGCLL